jgi:hypothetical protein
MATQPDKLRQELVFQLRGGNAHAKFDDVVKNFPEDLRGNTPKGMPYSGWQLLEHIRIAQDDILRFSKNADSSYEQPNWPADYWPKSPEPPNPQAWNKSIKSYHSDLDEFVGLIGDPKSALFESFPWGGGQTLFHEAMLLVDHAAYHLGEIVAVRRVLKIWPGK